MKKSNLNYLTSILSNYKNELSLVLTLDASFEYSKGYVIGELGILERIITDLEEAINIVK
jgi:hypothetical protein